MLLTGFIRDLLIQQWSNPLNILADVNKQYVWKAGADTGILIESAFKFRPEITKKRPGIFIKRNPFKPADVGIGGMIQGGGLSAYPTEKGAHEHYISNYSGSHTLFVVHSSDAAAEMVAFEVIQQMLSFKMALAKQLQLRNFKLGDVGSISQLEEFSESYVVPITVQWSFESVHEVMLESRPLKRVVFDLETNAQ